MHATKYNGLGYSCLVTATLATIDTTLMRPLIAAINGAVTT